MYLLIIQSHFFCIKMGCGLVANTRAELLALLALMFFSKEIGISTLHVYGDSFVIINWENEKEALSSLDLDAWCLNVFKLKAHFLTLDFQHVYREHNEWAYSLSKEVLPVAIGLLSFTKYYEGVIIGEDKLQLF